MSEDHRHSTTHRHRARCGCRGTRRPVGALIWTEQQPVPKCPGRLPDGHGHAGSPGTATAAAQGHSGGAQRDGRRHRRRHCPATSTPQRHEGPRGDDPEQWVNAYYEAVDAGNSETAYKNAPAAKQAG